MTQSRQIVAQTAATETREEIFQGDKYLVVPVIAMVEGVRLGMNQEFPELGLASEFGKFPWGWNGRPIVNGHPTVDGTAVSANSPEILEIYAFGMTMNTYVDGDKLKMEAWINLSLVEEKDNTTIKAYVDRINAGEVIEVSVGFFSEVEQVSGNKSFKGQSYGGIWRNIVPDHLAFLPQGTTGACSIEAGCGVPRINEASMANGLKTDAGSGEPKANCGCGGGESKPCSCDHSPTTNSTGGAVETTSNSAGDAVSEPSIEEELKAHQHFFAHSIPDGVMDNDVRNALRKAVNDQIDGYAYVMGFTQSKVIFEKWSEEASDYRTFQQEFSMDSEGKVTLSGTPVEVTLMTTIKVNSGVVTQESGTDSKENDMTVENKEPVVTPQADPAVTTQSAPPAAPLTVQQYIEQAPPEMREMLSSGMRLHQAQKDAAIKALKDSGRCKFSDDYLKAQTLETLNTMVELAAVPNYAGVAAPLPLQTQAADDGFVPLPAPMSFN